MPVKTVHLSEMVRQTESGWTRTGIAIQQAFSPDPELMDEVDAVIEGCPAGISVVFCDLLSGERWSWNETQAYYIASVFKLPYSLWLFERADAVKST